MAEMAALHEAAETEALASLHGRQSQRLNAAKQWRWPRSRVRRRLAKKPGQSNTGATLCSPGIGLLT